MRPYSITSCRTRKGTAFSASHWCGHSIRMFVQIFCFTMLNSLDLSCNAFCLRINLQTSFRYNHQSPCRTSSVLFGAKKYPLFPKFRSRPDKKVANKKDEKQSTTSSNPVLRFLLRFLSPITTKSTPTILDEPHKNVTTEAGGHQTLKRKSQHSTKPKGTRWAVSSSQVDFTGKWKPVVTPEFKKQYDEYLRNSSQPFAFRQLVLSVIGLTKEEFYHEQDGRELVIRGVSPAGVWERTLVSSGSDFDSADFEPFNVTFKDPDGDPVQVEAWWEDEGTIHKSRLRGKPRVCGGEFETTRYLVNGTMICVSEFHPGSPDCKRFKPGYVKWTYIREGG